MRNIHFVQAKFAGVTLHFANVFPENSYRMSADSHKLKQVIRNLVSNAIKFANKEEGIVAVKVDLVSTSSSDDIDNMKQVQSIKGLGEATTFIRLQVTDNGAGISKVSTLKFSKITYFVMNLIFLNIGKSIKTVQRYHSVQCWQIATRKRYWIRFVYF